MSAFSPARRKQRHLKRADEVLFRAIESAAVPTEAGPMTGPRGRDYMRAVELLAKSGVDVRTRAAEIAVKVREAGGGAPVPDPIREEPKRRAGPLRALLSALSFRREP